MQKIVRDIPESFIRRQAKCKYSSHEKYLSENEKMVYRLSSETERSS